MSNVEIKYIGNACNLQDYLASLPKPSWYKSVIVHHTIVPTVASWKGLRTMNSMWNYYQSLGWDGAPHLFIAPDGIYQMNKLTRTGTHSNAANAWGIAVEVVGFYDVQLWQEPIKSFASDTVAALLLWGGLTVSNIQLHRWFNPQKTCPGRAIQLPWIQELVRASMEEMTLSNMPLYLTGSPVSNVRQGPALTYPIAAKAVVGSKFYSAAEHLDENGDKDNNGNVYKWYHVTRCITDPTLNDTGFVRGDLLTRLN